MKKIKIMKKMNWLLPPIFLILIFSAFAPQGSVLASGDDSEIVKLTKDLMRVTEELRGLDFMDDLPVDLVTADEMAEIIDGLLDMEISEEDNHNFSNLYIMLGLMPRGSNLRNDYQAMTEEQVAGLYDPEEKCFYVVEVDLGDMIGSMFGEESGALGDFLGGLLEGMGSGIGDVMTNTIIVHELTHALDDQYYDIEGMMETLGEQDSDDASLAYQSLIEGNATRIMNLYTAGEMGLDPEMLGDLSGMNISMAESMMNYNPFLERIMLIPYLQGEVFVNHIIEAEGYDALEEAFLDPPQSMEQILHPEKYTSQRDIPSYTPEPDLSGILNGWELEASDTLGELLISLVFEMQAGNKGRADEIAYGWDYDIITTWRSPGNDLALAWVTIWDTEDDAEFFYDSYCDILELKYTTGKWEHRDSSSALYTMFGLAAGLELSGKIVTVVEGVPEEYAQDCLDEIWPTDVDFN